MSGGLVSIFGGLFSSSPDDSKPAVFQKQAGEADMTSTDIANVLRNSLPERHAQFADAYAVAALNHAALGMKPLDFALLHAGLIDRESQAGNALRPRGPGGTGDPTPRWYATPPDWANELYLVTGKTRTIEYDDGSSSVENEVAPPAYAGADVPGWGYGLGQIDFVSFRPWLDARDWKDPFVNLDKSAEILSVAMEQLGDIRLGVAAYNAGVKRVKRSADNPDAVTTGGNYSADVIARANGFGLTRAV